MSPDSKRKRTTPNKEVKHPSDQGESLDTNKDLSKHFLNSPLNIQMLLWNLERRPEPADPVEYRALPAYTESQLMAVAQPIWRIQLYSTWLGPDPIGIDVRGDVVIGRGPDCDFDLDEHSSVDFGVSRRHAMLRPTKAHLFLLDLDSTNGTLNNMITVGLSSTCALQDADIITLGRLNITIKIIRTPSYQ